MKKKTKITSAKKFATEASAKKVKSPGEPQTMEELLAQTGYQLHGLKRGDTVEGVLVEKTKQILYLDIGGKTEGMVIDREMKAAADFIKELKVGDKVTAIVTQPENDKGQTLLSLKKAAQDAIWGEFAEKLKTGQSVKVIGLEVNRGGLIVEARGAQGFIPTSQFSPGWLGRIDQLIGRGIEVKPIEVGRQENRLIFSEKEVSQAELIKELKQALKKVKVGDIFQGEVTGVMPFGFFVKIADKRIPLEGLVHISEISWEKVDDPSKFYKQGDKLKVKVLAVDEKTGKLNLSAKQLQTDPWMAIETKYPLDTKVKGEVIRLAPFGVFVNLEPGIEGLIHISKIPAEKTLKVGDKVDCFVESIDKENRRMSLGLVLKEKPVGYK